MKSTRLAIAAALSALFALSAAPAAHAGVLAASATSCDPEVVVNPFTRWYDYADYVAVPGGSFEPGEPPWTLSRANVVAGNESFQVGGAGDGQSLSITGGGSAQSPVMCVGVEHPTLRLFGRNTGSPLSTLAVSVQFRGPLDLPLSAPIGVVAGDGTWRPTLPMAVVANLLPLLPGEMTPVTFTFTPVGIGASWRIDDVYVDPYRKG